MSLFWLIPDNSNRPTTNAIMQAAMPISVNPAPTKVALASCLVREISPATKVTGFVGDLLDEVVLDELVRCDLIVGCTDSNYARAALATSLRTIFVPVLDLAVQMRAEEGILREQIGEIARYAPGLPCPRCRGRVSVEGIRYETATEAERQFRPRQRQQQKCAAWMERSIGVERLRRNSLSVI